MLVAVFAAVLAACGGGTDGATGSASTGGDPVPTPGSFTYTGVTTQASVTADNHSGLAAGAVYSTVSGGATGNAITGTQTAGVQAAKAGKTNASGVVTDTVADALAKAFPGETSLSALALAPGGSQILSGSCGGSASVTVGTLDIATMQVSGAITFNQYCQPDVVVVRGTLDFIATVVVSGASPTVGYSVSSASITTREGTLLDLYVRHAGIVYRLDALEMGVEYVSGNSGHWDVTVRGGRLYHPTHGWVEVSTLTPLRILPANAYPTSGSLLLVERRGNSVRSRALITAIDSTRYQLQLDANGDWTYETTTTGLWADLR